MHAFSNVPSCVLNGGITMNARQQSNTESIPSSRWICEAVDNYVRSSCMKDFSNTIVELVVSDRTPVRRLLILWHRLHYQHTLQTRISFAI